MCQSVTERQKGLKIENDNNLTKHGDVGDNFISSIQTRILETSDSLI